MTDVSTEVAASRPADRGKGSRVRPAGQVTGPGVIQHPWALVVSDCARYKRLVPRLGKQRALVALQRSILTSVWHMLSADVDYHDLGADHFANINPDRAMRRIVRQANALGYTVRFDPLPAA